MNYSSSEVEKRERGWNVGVRFIEPEKELLRSLRMLNIRHAGIVVSDLKKSLRFYKDLLRLKIIKDHHEKSNYIETILGIKRADVRTIKLAADDGNLIELIYYYLPKLKSKRKANINEIGSSHISFLVKNVDREYLRLKKRGVEFISPPKVSPNNYAKVCFCKDPDGIFVELVEILGDSSKKGIR